MTSRQRRASSGRFERFKQRMEGSTLERCKTALRENNGTIPEDHPLMQEMSGIMRHFNHAPAEVREVFCDPRFYTGERTEARDWQAKLNGVPDLPSQAKEALDAWKQMREASIDQGTGALHIYLFSDGSILEATVRAGAAFKDEDQMRRALGWVWDEAVAEKDGRRTNNEEEYSPAAIETCGVLGHVIEKGLPLEVITGEGFRFQPPEGGSSKKREDTEAWTWRQKLRHSADPYRVWTEMIRNASHHVPTELTCIEVREFRDGSILSAVAPCLPGPNGQRFENIDALAFRDLADYEGALAWMFGHVEETIRRGPCKQCGEKHHPTRDCRPAESARSATA